HSTAIERWKIPTTWRRRSQRRDRRRARAALKWGDQPGRTAMWSHGSLFWTELLARDVERAKKFYGSTIGWTFEATPMPNGTYWVAKMDDEPVGGIFPKIGPDFDGRRENELSY